MIYLDHAGATPLDPRVRATMEPYLGEEGYYNPSALYSRARQLRSEIDNFRKSTAATLSVKPNEVYFTAGATESVNMALAGVLRREGGGAAITAIEHSAVSSSAHGFSDSVVTIAVDSDGRVSLSGVKAAIQDNVCILSIGLANSEIGTLQPLAEISHAVEEIREERNRRSIDMPLYLHTDASAAAGYVNVQPRDLGVDLLTLNGAKIYGPKQSGILYVRHGVELEPLIYGGNQERGLRSGTENIAAIAGFSAALELAQVNYRTESKRQRALQARLMSGIEEMEGAQINGGKTRRIAGNINASFAGVDGETLVHYLDAHGIAAATGAACNAGSDEPSEVLQAIGCSAEMIRGSLRVSMGRATTEADINQLLASLSEIIPKLRQRR